MSLDFFITTVGAEIDTVAGLGLLFHPEQCVPGFPANSSFPCKIALSRTTTARDEIQLVLAPFTLRPVSSLMVASHTVPKLPSPSTSSIATDEGEIPTPDDADSLWVGRIRHLLKTPALTPRTPSDALRSHHKPHC